MDNFERILDAAGSRKQGGNFAAVGVYRSARLQLQVVIEDHALKQQGPRVFDKVAASGEIDRVIWKIPERANQALQSESAHQRSVFVDLLRRPT